MAGEIGQCLFLSSIFNQMEYLRPKLRASQLWHMARLLGKPNPIQIWKRFSVFKIICRICVARKLMGENLEVVWSEFSTLSSAVYVRVQLHDIYKYAHI
jgi:hypothetical protein